MRRSRIVAILLAGAALVGACGGGDPESEGAAGNAATPAGQDVVAPPVVPAEEAFARVPAEFTFQEASEMTEQFRGQLEQVFASAPSGLELHSVAARRVLDQGGDVLGAVVAISVELQDASNVPDFQEGLLSGLGAQVEEIELDGMPAFYEENNSPAGQDLVLFFHSETVAVEVYGVSPEAAKDIAAALAGSLAA